MTEAELSLDGIASWDAPRGGHFRYRFAYPKGAPPSAASRWSHFDELDVREELWDVRDGDHVVDIGSAFGSYAFAALAAGAASAILINPSPIEQAVTWETAKLNGWQDRVQLIQKGLWSRNGWLSDEDQRFEPESMGPRAEFEIAKLEDGKSTQRFPVCTLDSLALEAPSGRIIAKLDVEGAEAHVVKGAPSFFSRFEPAFVLTEVHFFKSSTLADEFDAEMRNVGYRLERNRPYHTGQISHALYVPR
jgi:FkbM family methyltransferase